MPRFLLLLALALAPGWMGAEELRPHQLSKKALELEVEQLRAQAAKDAERIQELEKQLQAQQDIQARIDRLEEAQRKTQAELATSRVLSPPVLPAPSKAEPDGGFSFVAVRNLPAADPAAFKASPAPAPPSTPEARQLAALRQQLREELTEIFDKIKANRRARYGEKDSFEGGTYVQLKSYDPETGKNKVGGKKPKLDVDLDYGINQDFPEKSTCFDSLSLSATLVHARLLRDQIFDLKSQTGLK